MSPSSKFSLFRRAGGSYYIVYADEGRIRWKSTRCKRKPEALQALTRFRELLKEDPVAKSFPAFAQDFLAYAGATFSAGTVEVYERSFRHLSALAGDLSLASLTPKHADGYKAKRLGEVSAVSVNMELRALRAALNTAVRWRLLEANPFSGITLASVPDTPPVYLTREAFTRLMDCTPQGWLRECIAFSVSTGMRLSEMLNLRWLDVDLPRRLIHIHSAGTFKTKQGKRRTIPMSDTVHAMLSVKAVRVTGEYVFTRKGRTIAGSYLQHSFKRSVRLAGLNDGLHWHSLRHTHASWLVQDGVSLYEVQRLLGHSSSKVTEVYSHLQPELRHGTVNRIDVPLG